MNKKRNYVRLLCGLTVLGGLFFGLVGLSGKQEKVPGQTLTLPNKISISEFSIHPNPPREGEMASLVLVLVNTSNQPITVNWQIWTDNMIKWQGTVSFSRLTGQITPTGPPVEKEKEIRNNWTAIAGPRAFHAVVDDSNTLGEPESWRQNNKKSLAFEVAVRAQQPPTTRQLLLEAHLAREVGAGFDVNPQRDRLGNNVPCDCGTRRWYMGNDSSMSLHNQAPSAYFRLVCTGLLGGKAEPEAFENFRLKNGYRVVRVDWDQTKANGIAAGYTTQVVPSIGSDNPYTKFSAWGDRGCNFEVWLAITIEGPADKDPYR